MFALLVADALAKFHDHRTDAIHPPHRLVANLQEAHRGVKIDGLVLKELARTSQVSEGSLLVCGTAATLSTALSATLHFESRRDPKYVRFVAILHQFALTLINSQFVRVHKSMTLTDVQADLS